jgi:hypothetical protein
MSGLTITNQFCCILFCKKRTFVAEHSYLALCSFIDKLFTSLRKRRQSSLVDDESISDILKVNELLDDPTNKNINDLVSKIGNIYKNAAKKVLRNQETISIPEQLFFIPVLSRQ